MKMGLQIGILACRFVSKYFKLRVKHKINKRKNGKQR